MERSTVVGRASAGDIRALKRGDLIKLHRDACSRADWAVMWLAIGIALARGADLEVVE